ncbi:TPA: hypothetical protein R0E49_003514 [Clostridioides difficile]|nr:hypothetical protein [Clostridioides difficile]
MKKLLLVSLVISQEIIKLTVKNKNKGIIKVDAEINLYVHIENKNNLYLK